MEGKRSKLVQVFALLAILLALYGCVLRPSGTETLYSKKLFVYSMEDVQAHNTTEDCWFVINNTVYDVTDFISQHPGEEAITECCGKDATRCFEERPIGSGTPHSERARVIREGYRIGAIQ